MEMRTEESLNESVSYRSPARVLVRSFHRSRDAWKAKYKALQQQVRAYRTEIRDLRRSREKWRANAETLEGENKELRIELRSQAMQSPPAPSRPSQPVLTRLSN